tara:strand:- start:458 stop:715 length:258 start_codon:yes stop_codon:yes gene_type:complete
MTKNKNSKQEVKVGDKVFIKIYLTNKIGYGKITEIHAPSKDGFTYASFACLISQRFELGNINDIIHEPKKSHWNLLNSSYFKKRS